MERPSDSASENVKSNEYNHVNYPHIIDELAEWSIRLDSSLSVENSYYVAVNLLRCRNISLYSVHPSLSLSSSDEIKASTDKETNAFSFPRINQLFSNSWRKISEIITAYFPPSQVLISYAHLRENNCPWQLGYLSSETVQGQALCLIATHWLELMELPRKLQSSNSLSTEHIKQLNDITPFELLQSSTVSFTHYDSDTNQIVANHSKITRKWYLSYVDPFPQWRIVSFVSFKADETFDQDSLNEKPVSASDNLYYITAIGYSNGSIDIIDLSIDENEKPDINQTIRRSRIFIPPPFTQSIASTSNRKPLFPIVFLSFIDIFHLLVGHFRGHVDLWHLDWKAKNFPGRMMMRIYPNNPCQPLTSSPLLAGVFDLTSNLLVVSSLPNANMTKTSKLMHQKLGLMCYHVSKKAPYLIPTMLSSPSDKTSYGITNFYGTCKDISIQLLCTLFRHNRGLTGDNQDAITSMVLGNFSTSLPTLASSNLSEKLLLGSLQSSGSYSVWLVPSCELLLLIANSNMNPNASNISGDPTPDKHNRPFRITWWTRPLESDQEITDQQDIQLSVLHENGLIDVLDIKKCGTEFYPKVARKLEGLKLPTYPVFATHSTDLSNSPHAYCLSEIILLSTCLKSNSLPNNTLKSQQKIFNYCVRCTRLKSTTHTGLFDHYLRLGKFQKALQLCCLSSKENSEIVYKQMWKKLSCEFWKLKNFEEFIHSTLESIQSYPLWVIKQCLDYLPKYVPFNVDYTLLLSCMRLVLNYGLKILQNNSKYLHYKEDIWYQTVSDCLSMYLTHINCVECIIQAELMFHPVNNESVNLSLVNQQTNQPRIDDILGALSNFRTHSLLDIAFSYARGEQFIALRILFEHFPRSVGLYRLLIASSLSETIDPDVYMNQIFSLPWITSSELDCCITSDGNNCVSEEVNAIQSTFTISLLLDWESLNDPLKLIRVFSHWLIERSAQIDSRSGLTDYALNLLCLGTCICEELVKGKEIDEEVKMCLMSLKKVRRDFIDLAHIIYSKYILPTTIINDISGDIHNTTFIRHSNDGIRAFQFQMKHFQSFNSKTILSLLFRVSMNMISTNSNNNNNMNINQISHDNTSVIATERFVSFIIYQLLPHLAERCTPAEYSELINSILLYAANSMGSLSGHIKLLESIKMKSFPVNYNNYLLESLNNTVTWIDNFHLDRNTTYVDILNPYQLLSSLTYVLLKYEPNFKADSLNQSGSIIISSLNTYLTDANHLIHAMLAYSFQDYNNTTSLQQIDKTQWKQLLESMQLIARCTSALDDLKSLINSMEKYLISSIDLPYSFIGYFYRCSHDGGYFRNLLNCWINIFGRLAVAFEREEVVDNNDGMMMMTSTTTHRRRSVVVQPRISEHAVEKLSDYLHQFYKILSEAFHNCPAEAWLTIGLQYALFASGNQYFIELSRDFCLNFTDDSSRINFQKISAKLSKQTLDNWGICLLNATRSYVNISIPSRGDLKMIFTDLTNSTGEFNVDMMTTMDPNELLARHCLSIVNSLGDKINWNKSLAVKFNLEEHLLNASTYLGTINRLLPSSIQRLPLVSPYKLRCLWRNDLNSNNNNENNNQLNSELHTKRINLLIESFTKLIILYSNNNNNNLNMAATFDSNYLNKLSVTFLMTIEQLKICFIRSMLNYLQSLSDNVEEGEGEKNCYPTVYLLNVTLQFLNELIEMPYGSCWLECAHWAGYPLEIFTLNSYHCRPLKSTGATTTPPENNSTNKGIRSNYDDKLSTWTCLHALYNIKRSTCTTSLNRKNSSSLHSPIELWTVERYRLRLARFALAYCTSSEELYDLTDFLGLCTLRLEWVSLSVIMSNDDKRKELDRKSLSGGVFKQFTKFISYNVDQSLSEEEKASGSLKRIDLCLPPFYSEISDSLSISELMMISDTTVDILAPIDSINYGAEEHRLWFAFLFNWGRCNDAIKATVVVIDDDGDGQESVNAASVWAKAILQTASRDTRLSLSYAGTGAKFCRFFSASQTSYLDQITSVILPLLEEASTNHSQTFDNTCRIALVLMCYTLISIYESKNMHSKYCLACGCFPSGVELSSAYCSYITSKDFSSKFGKLRKQLINACLLVLRESLTQRLVNRFPGIDYSRFCEDKAYREDSIYGLCATHFSLGLRLCTCYSLSQLEGLFCRLEYLFRDEDYPASDTIKQKINTLIKWILKLPNGREILLQRSEKNIYPFLSGFEQIRLFFHLLPAECETCLFDGITIELHRKILTILCKTPEVTTTTTDDHNLCVNRLSYQEFLKSLHEPLSQLHKHSLFNYLKSEHDAEIVGKVVEQIQTDDDAGDDNNKNHFSPLHVGDVYAIYAMRIFYNISEHKSYAKNNSDALMRLFKFISPGNTSRDVTRFMNWLNELLYSEFSSQHLSIKQRHFILEVSQLYTSRMSSGSIGSEWRTAEESIKLYVEHFKRITHLLNNILFPQRKTSRHSQQASETDEIDISGNFENKYALPKEFYQKLISMKPDDNQSDMLNFLKELIIAVKPSVNSSSYSSPTSSVSMKISASLETLGKLLPSCLKTFKIDTEIWIDILCEGLSAYFCILPSVFELRYEVFTQSNITGHKQTEQPLAFVNSQAQSIYPYLQKFLDLFIISDSDVDDVGVGVGDDDPSSSSSPPRVNSEQLLVCLLANSTIRRLFGASLLASYTEIGNDWQTSDVLSSDVLSIFSKTIKSLLLTFKSSSRLSGDEWDKLLCINNNNNDDDVDDNNVDELKRCIQRLIDEISTSGKCSSKESVGDMMEDTFSLRDNAELIRSVIELVDLIFNDDIIPEKSDFLQQLWTHWYQYCQKSGLVFLDNGLCNSQLLIYAWTSCCIPPVEFAKAGLKILSEYYSGSSTSASSSSSSPSLGDLVKSTVYPSAYQAAILNVGLMQSSIEVINTVLSLVTMLSDESVIHCLDSNVCCYFICSNPNLWLSLPNTSYYPAIVYGKIFHKMFNSLINFLEFSNSVVRCKIGRLLCILLRDKDMWLEAGKLCTIVHHIRPGSVPMAYLMKLVQKMDSADTM
uniref:Uncharacterized protein n=1 Tax=Trichobilharzia regenti TaxID=157069 RepID=A0AA85J516_TRIRE|nr:unnamed protein product [Trichobilharzia regenti]